MRFLSRHILALTALTVVPGLKPIAKAQDLAGLPDCAKPALLAAFQASGCKASDANCLCSNPNLLTSLQSYIKDACDPADQAAVIAFGETYCGVASTAMESSSMSMTGMPMSSSTSTSRKPTSPHVIPTGSSSMSYHKSMTYSTTATATTTNSTGSAAETGLSAAALAVAVGGIGWLFAEL